jgi:hypothetical protein
MQLAPFRILVDMAHRMTSRAEREDSRADPCQSELRKRFNVHFIYLCSQLHILRPKLVLPPTGLIGNVLGSDVANAKSLTNLMSSFGMGISYQATLPLRVEAECAAYRSRVLCLCVAYLSGNRWCLGFDNINKLRRFLNGGCLDLIGAAAFRQLAPMQSITDRSETPRDPATLDDAIFSRSEAVVTARDMFIIGQYIAVVGALCFDQDVRIELPCATTATSLVRRKRSHGASKSESSTSSGSVGYGLRSASVPSAMVEQTFAECKHDYAPVFGGSFPASSPLHAAASARRARR